jgi:hypothetical protein
MVANLDEISHCDCADARTDPVIVPEGFSDLKIPVPVQRQLKRLTLWGKTTAGGGQLKRLVVIHRDTVETEPYESEFTPDRVYYRTQDDAFVMSKLFTEWSANVLFPYCDEARRRP